GAPYQGSSRLAKITPTPIAARRSFGPSPRSPRPTRFPTRVLKDSVERLSATVTRVEIVPIVDCVLSQLPAEVDLAIVEHAGEVDQAAVEVADDDARLVQGPDQVAELEERLA